MRVESRSASADPHAFCRRFCELPGKVRRDPFRVALQPAALTQRLIDLPSAGTAEFFLALSAGGEVLGRIGVNLSPAHPGIAYAGFFEIDLCSDAASAAASTLLDRAAEWARSHGAGRLLGPVDISTWFAYRLAVERGSAAPSPRRFSWEPVNPPEYVSRFADAGMSEVQEYHSLGFTASTADAHLPGYEGARRACELASARGFTMRPLDPARLESRELPLLHELSHQAFRDAFLFEPLAYPAFASLYATAVRRFDLSPSRIAEAPDGRPAGFVIAFFDGDHVVIKTVAVLPEFRSIRLSSALLCPVLETARARGVRHGVSALVMGGAPSEHLERRSEREAGEASWRHVYALFGKSL